MPSTNVMEFGSARCKPRVLILEDESLIAVMEEDLIAASGCEVVGPVATIEEALSFCETTTLHAAVLDVLVRGEPIHAVVEVLKARGIPFGFATGVERLPEQWQSYPTVTKPFTERSFRDFLASLLHNGGRVDSRD